MLLSFWQRSFNFSFRSCFRALHSGNPQPDFALMHVMLPVLARLLDMEDNEIVADACWALSYLSNDETADNSHIQAVLDAGVAPRLVEMLSRAPDTIKTPALRAVGNIVTGDFNQTQVMMKSFAHYTYTHVRWLLSIDGIAMYLTRICYCFACFALSSCGVLSHLLALLVNPDRAIRKEACWSVYVSASAM